MTTRVVLAFAFVLCPFSELAAQPDRSAPPKMGPPPSLSLPPIQHYTLTNGIQVVLLEKHAVPLVQLDLVIRAGSTMDPAEKSGLASLTASMLTEGAGTRNALELADAIDYLGADINAGSGQHTTGIQLHTPLSKLDSAIALMADVARRPTFPSEELERRRKELLTVLLQRRDVPSALASVTIFRTLYGGQHPYGIPASGNERSIRSITTTDLRKFHGKYFVPGNTSVIVVGDVTAAGILPKLEKAFGSWKGKSTPPPALPPIGQIKSKTLIIVDKPDAPQSVIMMGRVGAARLTDDFYPLLVMNTILGGSFTSRLNMNLREKHGYSYGASSRFDFRPLPGPFIASASVQTDVTDKALREFVNELKGMLVEVSDAEIERAKNYLALGFPGDFQSVGQIAGQLESLLIYRLPDDYLNKHINRVLAVTKNDVLRVAQKYIDVETMAFVVVGDRKAIEAGVTALNLAPATFFSIDDVLGPAPAIAPE